MKPNHSLDKLFQELNLPRDPTSAIGNQVVYYVDFESYKMEIRTFSISVHVDIVFRWCNMIYTKRFWGEGSGYAEFVKACMEKALNPAESQYLFFMNGTALAYFEIYQVSGDVLSHHFDAGNEDYGIHLLLAPYRDMLDQLGSLHRDFSVVILSMILQYLFTKTSIETLLAEPDRENVNACRLAQRTGFRFLKEIQLPEKIANLYCIKKDEYAERAGPFEFTH